jgi:hypothetical protein
MAETPLLNPPLPNILCVAFDFYKAQLVLPVILSLIMVDE